MSCHTAEVNEKQEFVVGTRYGEVATAEVSLEMDRETGLPLPGCLARHSHKPWESIRAAELHPFLTAEHTA